MNEGSSKDDPGVVNYLWIVSPVPCAVGWVFSRGGGVRAASKHQTFCEGSAKTGDYNGQGS